MILLPLCYLEKASQGVELPFGPERLAARDLLLVDRTNDLYSDHAMRLVGSA